MTIGPVAHGKFFNLLSSELRATHDVSVLARHLELKGATPDHRVHDEHGGDELQGGDAAKARWLCVGALVVRIGLPMAGVVHEARLRALASFGQHGATGAATTPRCGCSTA